MVADFSFGVWPGLPQSHALLRSVAGARVDKTAVCRGAALNFLDLSGNVVAFRGAAVLLFFAPDQHRTVCLYAAAVYVFDAVERRHRVAGDEVSTGGITEGNGVSVVEAKNVDGESSCAGRNY